MFDDIGKILPPISCILQTTLLFVCDIFYLLIRKIFMYFCSCVMRFYTYLFLAKFYVLKNNLKIFSNFLCSPRFSQAFVTPSPFRQLLRNHSNQCFTACRHPVIRHHWSTSRTRASRPRRWSLRTPRGQASRASQCIAIYLFKNSLALPILEHWAGGRRKNLGEPKESNQAFLGPKTIPHEIRKFWGGLGDGPEKKSGIIVGFSGEGFFLRHWAPVRMGLHRTPVLASTLNSPWGRASCVLPSMRACSPHTAPG